MPSITNTILSACALTLLLPAAMGQTVRVSGGQVAGRAMDDGSAIFYGIPYAASPAGAQRWQPPAPRAPWPGVLDASQPAPACVQADVGWNRAFVQGAQEDCLTLAIRTPSLQASARLPVLVYIHGGSNAAGGAGSLADDAIHREGIVLVKIQYRLGAFGFLTDNHGLQDQIAALRWVRANIAAFGGDPSLVTISGNSAGATDALFLTYSPLAQGLFRRAILQSAAPGAPRSRAHSEAMRDTLLDRLHLPHGEPGMTALRALPADAIQAAAQNLPTSAGVDPSFTWEQQNLDGAVMADGYADAYAKGAGRDIDIIIGSNTQELGADRKAETGDALVQAAFGAQTAAARALYDRRGDKAALGSLPTQVMTDMWFRCPAHWLSRRMHGTGARVWRYEFGYGAPGSHKPPEHTSEMDYIYRAPSANWPPLQRYWANFIRTGNPNGADLPEWPEVAQRDASLSIAPEGIKAVRGAHAALCELMFNDVDYPQSANAELTATTKVSGGALVGLQADQLKTYLGIPYAAPPVGPLRWRAPQAVPPWRGVKLANRYSAACAQTAQWVTHPKSEDCLYLNIWAPAASEKLPVLVWIHGGGYYGGTAAQAGFDGAHLARRGAVVVTLNYRLGIFGFFAHPELPGGNQGILDQIAALRWVQQNIAAFGGDPARVTIFGESAGGESVAILVASPLAKGLFQRAIAQSGNDGLPMYAAEHHRFLDLAAARANGAAFAQAAGAPRLADLRKLSVAELHRQPWSPRTFIDGHLLREDLSTTYRHQRQNDVPLLVGWNAEEGKDLAPEILGTGELTAAKHRALVSKLLGHAPSTALLSAYPGATDSQATASLNQLTNDWWGWRMAYWARLQARHGRAKSYVYFFAHQPAAPLTPCGYGCGAGHGAEIPYVFDNLDQDRRPWRTADRQLAGRLATSWINFARTGNPNSDGLPPWPSYDGSADTIMRIGAEAELKAHPLPDFSLFERHLGGQN